MIIFFEEIGVANFRVSQIVKQGQPTLPLWTEKPGTLIRKTGENRDDIVLEFLKDTSPSTRLGEEFQVSRRHLEQLLSEIAE